MHRKLTSINVRKILKDKRQQRFALKFSITFFQVLLLTRDAGEGDKGEYVPLLPFLTGTRGSEVSFLNCFYSILATVFQPENTTGGILCSKLTEIHLIPLLPYLYKAST